MGGGGGKKPQSQQVAKQLDMPTAPAAPPEPEKTAVAPVVDDSENLRKTRETKRRGASALTINMNVPGGGNTALGVPKP